MIQADVQIRLGKLTGINQERVGRQATDLADCQNIVGEPSGFSVWKGRVRYTKTGLGKNWGLMNVTWPDEHESLIVMTASGVKAIQAGEIYDITGDRTDLSLMTDLRNPVHFTRFSYGKYAIGSFYRRQTPFYWDGHTDHDIESVTVPSDIAFRVVESWAGRLWGIGSEQHPLQVFYGDSDELEIKAAQWLSFLDNPLASRIVGMRAAERGTAFVWGDRGVWQVNLTGSYPLFVSPKLLHSDCDCVANNTIISIPGVGWAWMGREGVWLMSGTGIQRVDTQTIMGRVSYRLKKEFDRIPINSQYLCSGFWYRQRGLAVWSYPTAECLKQHEWQEPHSIAWRPGDNTWWLIDQGWQSVAEVVHTNRRLPVGTDPGADLEGFGDSVETDSISGISLSAYVGSHDNAWQWDVWTTGGTRLATMLDEGSAAEVTLADADESDSVYVRVQPYPGGNTPTAIAAGTVLLLTIGSGTYRVYLPAISGSGTTLYLAVRWAYGDDYYVSTYTDSDCTTLAYSAPSVDAYLYLIDYNTAYDRVSVPMQWFAELEWLGDAARKIKWLNATLERPFSGADKVMAKFWTRHQASAPVEDAFSLDEAYDDASRKKWSYLSQAASAGDLSVTVQDADGWPASGYVRFGDTENRGYSARSGNELTLQSALEAAWPADTLVEIKDLDPGGPNDGGLSPDPLAQCRIPIRLEGEKIKVRLSNNDDGTYYNGPAVPMISLTLMGRTVK